MDRNRPAGGWRASALAVALFAITLNFLQPLAHAAMMRDGGSASSATLWRVFCQANVAEQDERDTGPSSERGHECCLGLAHAPVLGAPAAGFIRLEPVVRAVRIFADLVTRPPGGIRDGPNQPRAPPASFA